MKEINIKLAPEEINLIMEGLGNLPFVKVYQLIGKIQEQAGPQLPPANGQEQEMAEPVAAKKH